MSEKSLENYIEELADISKKMNDEQLHIEQAVALYKKGLKAAEAAEKMLNKYEAELEIVHESENENDENN
ncbi:MAG: exodeoxyribonuclease VII small subunit [Christensenellaceae bacterium]